MERAKRAGRPWQALLVTLVVVGSSACASGAGVSKWDPAAFRDLDTLEFLTVGPGEGKHWSTVWLVVIDDQLYVRLGSRAADRMRRNASAPLIGVRIGGREYEHVRAEEVPAMIEPVAAAMAAKYWSDVLVRQVSHPLTMRFVLDHTAER